MSLDNKTVKDIARLARINVTADQLTRYSKDLGNILDLVAQMDAVDTEGVEPMTHPFDATLRMRADEVTETNQREHYQGIAPSTENGLYLVPKVVEK